MHLYYQVFLAYSVSIVKAENSRMQGRKMRERTSSRIIDLFARMRAAVCAAQMVQNTPSATGSRPLHRQRATMVMDGQDSQLSSSLTTKTARRL